MAIYRFRVSFEDYDDIMREIDIRSNQTFEDLHHVIQKSTGYSPSQSSSFYVSTDQWIKGKEIAYMPSQRKIDNGTALMDKSKLSSFIDDPHQKFYYTYNFERPYDFHVELMKIMLDDDKTKDYPLIFKSVGEAPKSLSLGALPVEAGGLPETDDFDFLNETEYELGGAEEMDELNEYVPEAKKQEENHEEEHEEEEKDEFADEFSDNEEYDKEDFSKDEY